jgi:hypothetical protein
MPADAAGAGGLVFGEACVEVADGANGGKVNCGAPVPGVELAVLFAGRGATGAMVVFGTPAVAAFAGESFCGVVEGGDVAFVAAPASGGSSGKSGMAGTAGELFVDPFDAARPDTADVDLLAAGSALATGIAIGGGVTVGAVEGQAGAVLSVDSDAPFVADSGGTPSGD